MWNNPSHCSRESTAWSTPMDSGRMSESWSPTTAVRCYGRAASAGTMRGSSRRAGFRKTKRRKTRCIVNSTKKSGSNEHCVKILACTTGWLRYRLPKRLRRYNSAPDFKGQKQKWFLLKMIASDDCVCVTRSGKPEFDDWRWVSYWYPVSQVVEFKRDVYRQALKELAPRLVVAARR